jgi:hypothetical protein
LYHQLKTTTKMDYRISIEELESQFEIMEMARNLIQEAMEEPEELKPMPIEETIEMPF